MDNKYPITLDDVKRFLATKGKDEEIGYCGNAMYCLLAQVLTWLYPDERPWRVDFGSYTHIFATQRIDLPSQLRFLALSFDHCKPQFDMPATKGQFRQYLEWLSTQQDQVTAAARMPFTIDDVLEGQS